MLILKPKNLEIIISFNVSNDSLKFSIDTNALSNYNSYVYDLKKKLIRPATPITVRVTGSSNMLGRVRGVVTSGDHKGKSVHISTLSSRVIGCPKNERLVRGRCIRR